MFDIYSKVSYFTCIPDEVEEKLLCFINKEVILIQEFFSSMFIGSLPKYRTWQGYQCLKFNLMLKH